MTQATHIVYPAMTTIHTFGVAWLLAPKLKTTCVSCTSFYYRASATSKAAWQDSSPLGCQCCAKCCQAVLASTSLGILSLASRLQSLITKSACIRKHHSLHQYACVWHCISSQASQDHDSSMKSQLSPLLHEGMLQLQYNLLAKPGHMWFAFCMLCWCCMECMRSGCAKCR